MSNAIARMTAGIEVRSKFDPPVALLEKMRGLLKIDRHMKEIFEGEDVRTFFLEHVEAHYPEMMEAASFIMDEYEQLGRGNFLVSTRTGKVIARVTAEDVYHPAPMMREREEGGPQHLVHKDEIHLKPEIEAFFLWNAFEEEREIDYLTYVRSSGVLAPDANPDFYTRAGRTSLLHRVESSFWSEPAPFFKRFLDFYPQSESSDGEVFRGTLEVIRPLQDMKSYSARTNFQMSIKAALSYRLLDQLAIWFEDRVTSGPDLEKRFAFGRAWGDVAVEGTKGNVYVAPGGLTVTEFKLLGMEINGSWYIRGDVELLVRPGEIRGGDLC